MNIQKTGRFLLVLGMALLVVVIIILLFHFEYVLAAACFVALLIALVTYVTARRQHK